MTRAALVALCMIFGCGGTEQVRTIYGPQAAPTEMMVPSSVDGELVPISEEPPLSAGVYEAHDLDGYERLIKQPGHAIVIVYYQRNDSIKFLKWYWRHFDGMYAIVFAHASLIELRSIDPRDLTEKQAKGATCFLYIRGLKHAKGDTAFICSEIMRKMMLRRRL